MKETPPTALEDSKPDSSFWPFVIWPLLLVIVYFLSAGPAAKLASSDRISFETYNTIYAPVGWLYGETFLRKPIGLYLHLWVPEAFDERGEINLKVF